MATGLEHYEFREAEPEEWASIATLLGRPAGDAAELRGHVQQEYEAHLAWLAVLPTVPAGRTIGRSATPPADTSGIGWTDRTDEADSASNATETVVGAVIAGLPRRAPATSGATGGADAIEGRVIWIGVAPEHRRRGIAGRLLELALEELRYRRAARATAEVDGAAVGALALFRNAGFVAEGKTLGLVLPSEAGETLLARAGREGDHAGYPAEATPPRPLSLDEVPKLIGLLIRLGTERAQDPHDDLEALTPSQVEQWLQRPATVALAAWETADSETPVALAWATRRPEDGVLRFIAVSDDLRRQGIGRALLAALVKTLARPVRNQMVETESGPALRPLRTQLHDPGEEEAFFRHAGFETEHVTLRLTRSL